MARLVAGKGPVAATRELCQRNLPKTPDLSLLLARSATRKASKTLALLKSRSAAKTMNFGDGGDDVGDGDEAGGGDQ